MADDSGIEIDYLHGAPGVYSARFLGEDISYSEKIQYILDELKKRQTIENALTSQQSPSHFLMELYIQPLEHCPD